MNQERAVFKHRCWLLLAGFLWLGGVTYSRAEIPVSGTEYQAFGKELETHIAHKDYMFYVNSFDMKTFMDVVEGGELKTLLPPEQWKMAEIGLRRGIALQLKNAKSFKFLHVAQLDGKPSVLMRLLLTNNTVNYYNFSLKYDPGGRMWIEDLYPYMSGEKLSDTMRQSLMPILVDANKSLLDRFFSGKPDWEKYLHQWEPMGQLLASGQNQQVLDLYAQLPESLQREKFILLLRLRAAQAVDKQDYLAAIRLWRQCYPDDPSIDFMSVDFYILTRQYDEALNCVNRLDRSIGDPYQDFIRATIYSQMKDDVNGEKFAKQGFYREPDLPQLGFLTIRFIEKRQDYDGCVKILKDMHMMSGISESDLDRALKSSPDHVHDPLIQSEAYQKWLGATAEPPTLIPTVFSWGTNALN